MKTAMKTAYELKDYDVTQEELNLSLKSPTQPVHQKDLWAKFDLEVTHIDTAQQTFSVDGWLNMWWKEESLDDKLPADKRRTVYKWNMYGDSENNRADALIRDDDGHNLPINPRILFHNGYDITWVSSKVKFRYDTSDRVVQMGVHFTADFYELFALQRFPWDRQVLNMVFHVRTRKGWNLLTQLPDWVRNSDTYRNDCPLKYKLTLSLNSTWKPLPPVVNYTNEDTRILSLPLQRKSSFYMYNVFLPLFIIASLSFITFAIDTGLGDRLEHVITIILTIVAFKFLIASQLPETAYMTLLDIYFVFGYFFLLLVAVENTISQRLLSDRDDQDTLDKWSAVVFGVVWVSLHLVILFGQKFNWFRIPFTRLFRDAWHQESSVKDFHCDRKRHALYSTDDVAHFKFD